MSIETTSPTRRFSPLAVAGLIVLIFVFLPLGWCGLSMANMPRAIANGVATLPATREMNATFPGTDNFISHYSAGSSVFNSRCLIHGRYELTIQTPILINHLLGRVKAAGPPRFSLIEYTKLEVLEGGQVGLESDGWQGETTQENWDRLIASGGDLSVLIPSVIKDRPVAGLQEFWNASLHP